MMNLPIYPDLIDKTAVVTGAGNGIGRAISIELARQGMNVNLLDISEQGLDQTMAGIENPSRKIILHKCDVRDETKVGGIFRQIGNIDTVVNNAGIGVDKSYALADLPQETWNRLLAVNVTGYFLVTKYAEKSFITQAEDSADKKYDGSLIYICSNAGILGSAKNAYCITNGARIIMMRQVALEMADFGVRANAVIPGDVLETGVWNERYLAQRAAARDMTIEAARRYYETRAPLGKKATAEQVAMQVSFLASPTASGNTTGQIYSCDGGQVMVK